MVIHQTFVLNINHGIVIVASSFENNPYSHIQPGEEMTVVSVVPFTKTKVI